MNETYTLRLSRHDRNLSNKGFILWLKESGHHVSMSNSRMSMVNGMPARSYSHGDARPSWADDVLSELIDGYSEQVSQEVTS